MGGLYPYGSPQWGGPSCSRLDEPAAHRLGYTHRDHTLSHPLPLNDPLSSSGAHPIDLHLLHLPHT